MARGVDVKGLLGIWQEATGEGEDGLVALGQACRMEWPTTELPTVHNEILDHRVAKYHRCVSGCSP